MAVSTWLLSLLEHEYRLLGNAFPSKYPGPWLVWEPGEWRPAKTQRESNDAPTVDLKKAAPKARPAGMDAFCFQLEFEGRRALTLGRASDSDVLVNELTLSRTHLLLRPGEAGVAPRCSNETKFGEERVERGEWRELSDGLVISTGPVRLTYLETVGMLERLGRSVRRRGAA